MLTFTGKWRAARILYRNPLVTPSNRLDMCEQTVRRTARRFFEEKNIVAIIWLFSLSWCRSMRGRCVKSRERVPRGPFTVILRALSVTSMPSGIASSR